MSEDKLKNLLRLMENKKLDALFISSASNISYLTNFTNFSKDEREAYLLIGNNFQYIITDGRYSESVAKKVSEFTLFERSQNQKISDLFKKLEIKILGIEEDNLTVLEYRGIKKHFKKLKHFEAGNLRSIKSREEINKLKKACMIGDKAFKYILGKIKAGITEKEIAFQIENFVKKQKTELAFPSIVAFGKNASVPHHQTGETKLDKKSGQFVLLDFGVKFDGYCSDMSRTIFFGNPTDKQKEIYAAVKDAQTKASEFLAKRIKSQKRILAEEVDRVAREYIISKNYPSIPHSLGHGIGLDVHERPYLSLKSKEELREGMVFSIEPGIYIPNFGGVRIEDIYAIEDGELRQITNAAKDLVII
mgnify:CR=1 FL=1